MNDKFLAATLQWRAIILLGLEWLGAGLKTTHKLTSWDHYYKIYFIQLPELFQTGCSILAFHIQAQFHLKQSITGFKNGKHSYDTDTTSCLSCYSHDINESLPQLWFVRNLKNYMNL